MIDHHRALRKGFPRSRLPAPGKTDSQVAEIFQRLAHNNLHVLGTRASAAQYDATKKLVPRYPIPPPSPGSFSSTANPNRKKLPGIIVAAAGTSDLPRRRRSRHDPRSHGPRPPPVSLTSASPAFTACYITSPPFNKPTSSSPPPAWKAPSPASSPDSSRRPSSPSPTSVGYGASFHGLAALLAMLNSCASGITVVNIDNGFGAAYAAAIMNRRMSNTLTPASQKEMNPTNNNTAILLEKTPSMAETARLRPRRLFRRRRQRPAHGRRPQPARRQSPRLHRRLTQLPPARTPRRRRSRQQTRRQPPPNQHRRTPRPQVHRQRRPTLLLLQNRPSTTASPESPPKKASRSLSTATTSTTSATTRPGRNAVSEHGVRSPPSSNSASTKTRSAPSPATSASPSGTNPPCPASPPVSPTAR